MKRILIPILVIAILLLSACGAPPTLEFAELAADDEEAKWENELGRWKPATAIIDGEEKALTSQYIKKDTYVNTSDVFARVELVFELDEEGSKLFEAITSRLIGQPLGIFEGDNAVLGEDGKPLAPIVQAPIVDRGVIQGLSLNEAQRLSDLLNSDQ